MDFQSQPLQTAHIDLVYFKEQHQRRHRIHSKLDEVINKNECEFRNEYEDRKC
jgi:hypothetical protein